MTLRIVGAGLGRTGTSSLRVALEQLLDGRCYHMSVVAGRAKDVQVWRRRVERGKAPKWRKFFDPFVASLDWPAAGYWSEIAAAHPDAFVLLSTRATAQQWYASFEKTILPLYLDADRYPQPAIRLGCDVTLATLTPRLEDADAAIAAYERHNAQVRATVAPERLIEWQPGDGWSPLCAALRIGEPDEPFPHVNSGDEFRDLFKLS
ncbi:MAG TPA: sulfotransferase [Acidimicrobiales bacterium]|nr:sulfotransferase [Acidimicrobiales bacterium]